MRDLMEIVDQKLKVVGNQKKYEVEYGVELHGEIVQWLKENTNTPYELDTEYDYESTEEYPNGKVKLKIDLDQATMGRLDRVLNPQRKKDKSRKGMPPKGW